MKTRKVVCNYCGAKMEVSANTHDPGWMKNPLSHGWAYVRYKKHLIDIYTLVACKKCIEKLGEPNEKDSI